MVQIKRGLLRKTSRYLGGAGAGVAGPLCVTCMVGMLGVAGGVAAMAGVAASTAAAMGMSDAVGSDSLLGGLPTVPWIPVAVLRPAATAIAIIALIGLGFNWRRHGQWGPLVLALPAVAYLVSVMYGWQSLVFTSLVGLSLYGAAILALASAGAWDIWITRAMGESISPRQVTEGRISRLLHKAI